MIVFNSMGYRYPDGTEVFADFNWQVLPGEAWAVLGPSGCGKTTLLYLLAGLRAPTQGALLFNGRSLDRPRPRTGLILQDYGLLPWADVRQNAALGLRVRGFYGPDGKHAPPDEIVEEIQTRVDPWLQRLGLAHVAHSYPAQLSGGQRQRTAIARTLILNPDLLLMDEPFASLDAPTREDLQDLVFALRAEQPLTTIIVTHTIEEAALLGQRILILGEPPNSQPLVIENPGAGRRDFHSTAEFSALTRQLRAAMEQRP